MATLGANELPQNYLFQNMRAIGTATSAGSPSGAVTPAYLGQLCFDTTNSVWYMSTGVAGSANTNWSKISN